MKANHSYSVHYRMNQCSQVQFICLLAHSKYEAYDKAVYELIPAQNDGCLPYSAWVDNVTYNNGNVRHFNTFEGKPY